MNQTKVYHVTGSAAPIHDTAQRILDLCELGDVAQARSLLVESDAPEMLLARGVVYYWLARLGLEFTIEEAKNVLTKADRSGANSHLCKMFLGLCYWRQGQPDEALIMIDEAADVSDPHIRFLALLSRSQVESKGRWQDSLKNLESMAELLDNENDCNKGKYFNQRANAFYLAFEEEGGEYRDRALIDYEAARTYFERCGSARYEGEALNNIAYLYRTQNTKEALYYVDLAINLFARINSRASMGAAKDTKAQIYLYADEPQQALKWANESIQLLTAEDDTIWLSTSYLTRGAIYKQLGRVDEALKDFEMAAMAEEVKKIQQALIKTSGKVTPAARLLGLADHSTLNFLIKQKHSAHKFIRRRSWVRRKSLTKKK